MSGKESAVRGIQSAQRHREARERVDEFRRSRSNSPSSRTAAGAQGAAPGDAETKAEEEEDEAANAEEEAAAAKKAEEEEAAKAEEEAAAAKKAEEAATKKAEEEEAAAAKKAEEEEAAEAAKAEEEAAAAKKAEEEEAAKAEEEAAAAKKAEEEEAAEEGGGRSPQETAIQRIQSAQRHREAKERVEEHRRYRSNSPSTRDVAAGAQGAAPGDAAEATKAEEEEEEEDEAAAAEAAKAEEENESPKRSEPPAVDKKSRPASHESLVTFSIVEARDLKPSYGTRTRSFEPSITCDVRNPGSNGVSGFCKVSVGSGVQLTEEDEANRKKERQDRREAEAGNYGGSPNSAKKGHKSVAANNSTKKKEPKGAAKGVNRVYDLARSTYQFEGYPSKAHPFELSISVRDADVLSPQVSNGQSANPAVQLWHSSDQDKKEISQESKLACVNVEGVTWVKIQSPHPVPMGTRGIVGKVLVRWCVSINQAAVESNYDQLFELVSQQADRDFDALMRREHREKEAVERGEDPEESYRRQQETERRHSPRANGQKKGQPVGGSRGSGRGGEQGGSQDEEMRFVPYKDKPYYSKFSHRNCHQTSKPFSELVQSRDAEFYTPVRPKDRPATGGESARGGWMAPPNNRVSSARSVNTAPAGHCSIPRLQWTNSALTQSAAWVPSHEAKLSATERSQHEHLRVAEKMRMRVAAAEAQRQREEREEAEYELAQGDARQEDRVDVGDDPQSVEGPCSPPPISERRPHRDGHPQTNTGARLLRPVINDLDRLPKEHPNSRDPGSRGQIVRTLFQSEVRARRTEKELSLLNGRKEAFESTQSKNVFEHLHNKHTRAFHAQKGSPTPQRRKKKGEEAKSDDPDAEQHQTQESTNTTATDGAAEGERATTSDKPAARPAPPPLSERLYPTRSKKPEEAQAEAKKWKTKLAELKSKHPSAIHHENLKKADDLDKLFA